MQKSLFLGIVGAGIFILIVLLGVLMMQDGGYVRTQVVSQPSITTTGACFYDVTQGDTKVRICEDSFTEFDCVANPALAASASNSEWHEGIVCQPEGQSAEDSDVTVVP